MYIYTYIYIHLYIYILYYVYYVYITIVVGLFILAFVAFEPRNDSQISRYYSFILFKFRMPYIQGDMRIKFV